ncbi:MAG: DUF262 domain-containing protein [Spirochaetia bacterium]|nr:DUF262 domain-containing protein [Spirochaetia bacterium]
MSEKIKPDDIGFENLMQDLKNGQIKIPDFQRDFVWTSQQIVNLLDSIYNHYPIGSFLFWQTIEKLHYQRNIGNINLPEAKEGNTINYVLDGQQRITSLFSSLEDAEIKIRENGKIRKRKLEIYFDLENEEFVYNPSSEAKDVLSKIRGWWPLPGGTRNYVKSLLEILEAIKNNNFNNTTLSAWIINKYSSVSSKKTTSGYIDIVRKTGFIKIDKNLIKLTDIGIKILETKSNELILINLIENVDFFDELIFEINNKVSADIKELHQFLEEKFTLDWQSHAQVQWRIYWLLSLGFVDLKDKKYFLSDTGKKFIEKYIIQKNEEATEAQSADVRFISVKKLLGYENLMDIIPKIKTENRKKSYNNVVNAFNKYKFSVIYVKNQPIETVCNIFERINNSGTILNVVDLMTAKTWSEDFNLKNKLYDFKKELKDYSYDSIPDIVLLQAISLHLTKYCNKKAILSLTKEQLCDTWLLSIEAIKKSVDFLRVDLNIYSAAIIPFNALLIPISYFFYHIGNKSPSKNQFDILKNWFWQASISNRYDSGLEGKLSEDAHIIDNLIVMKPTTFNYKIPILNVEVIKNQNYSIGNAFAKTILSLFAYNRPRDLKNNSEINLSKSFSKYNSKEFHHIFPVSYLKQNDIEMFDFVNSIVNIAFLPSNLNKEIKNDAPSTYIPKLGNANINETLVSHLIDTQTESGLIEDDFEKFLDYRAGQIITQLLSLSGFTTESSQKDYLITPSTPFSNKITMLKTLRKCSEYIYWFDPYFAKNGFELLAEEIDSSNIQYIKILSGTKQTNIKLKDLFKKFRKEMENQGIKVEFNVITDNSISNIHDRWILSSNINFNIPSINTIDRGQFSEIKETQNRPPFELWWDNSKKLVEDWSEIEKSLT